MREKRKGHRRILGTALALALTASFVPALPASAVVEPEEFQWTELSYYETSWLGNSHPGIGENGNGEWVQDFIHNVDFVNGTVITSSDWDEAGRCTGLYRDDRVNTVTLRTDPELGAWGWGTGSYALAADEENIWLYTTANDLLRFSWNYTELDSHTYLGYVASPGATAVSMTEKDGTLYALREDGTVETWDGIAMTKEDADFTIEGASKLVINKATGELWVIVGNEIKNYDTEGNFLGKTITDAGKPVNVAIDEKDGYLIVTDNGERQQVLFYDISGSGTPVLVKAFGDYGGIGSGVPGEYKPLKFFDLVGAGTDAEGNIYVAMSLHEAIIRKFTPDGTLVWEQASFHFVDSADFLPGSDGTKVYGIDEIYDMDYSKSYGEEATLTAITRDFVKYPGERQARDRAGSNLWARVLDGRTFLFVNGMQLENSTGGNGLDIYAFDDAQGHIAHYVGTFDGPGSGEHGNWAYDIDENGDLWVGNDEGSIIRYDFSGFDQKGCPVYGTENSETFEKPSDFTKVQRLIYDEANDKMFLVGYTEDYPQTAWGLVGRVLRAYKWNDGQAELLFETLMPMEPESEENMLSPKAIDIAGDYIFAVSCRKARVHIFSAITGEYVSTMKPEPELGESGWVDIPYGIRATKRSNGEYVVIVEEDWRAKNVLYRWTPGVKNGHAGIIAGAPDETSCTSGDALRWFGDGRYAIYENVKFDNAGSITFEAGSSDRNLTVRIRLDSVDGEVIGEAVDLAPDRIADGRRYYTVLLNRPVTGIHNLVLTTTAGVWNEDLYTMTLNRAKDGHQWLAATDYDVLNGSVETDPTTGKVGAFEGDGKYLIYQNIEFKNAEVLLVKTSKHLERTLTMNVYLDSTGGRLLGSAAHLVRCRTEETENDEWYAYYAIPFSEPVTGVHNLVLTTDNIQQVEGETYNEHLYGLKLSEALELGEVRTQDDTYSLEVTKYREVTEPVVLIAAKYDQEGRLIDFKPDTFDPAEAQIDETKTLSVTMTKAAEESIKAFVWNSLEGMKPLR